VSGCNISVRDPCLNSTLLTDLCRFRWVELQLSLFLDQKPRFRHPEDVVSNLDRLEKVTVSGRAELDKTYSQILDRNTRENSRDRQYAWAAYSIVLYARRELTFEELAAAVRWHNDSDEDDNSVTVEYVTDICRDCLNKSTSGVAEFAHVSAKEFLLDKKNGDDLEYSPERCHELLAKICFNNLLRVYQRPAFSEEETSPEEGNSLNDESKALKAYTQLYWPEHLGFVDGKISENLSGKLWQFLLKDSAPSSTYVKWADGLISKYSHEFEIMRTLKRDYHDRLSHRLFSAASSPPTPLAALCAFGFVSLIPLLNVFNLFDWNRMQTVDKTEWGTLLFITAEEGHEVVVELLLTKGADINARGGESGTVTALYAASRAGHKKVVELLLTKGADVNAQGGYHGNALQAASSKGHEKVVELLLLAKDAEVNAQGGHFGNALCAASHAGHEKVVELLLAKGAYVNAQGGYYGSALYAASYAGHEKVVERLLLATGVDVNAEGGHFGNVLQAASDRGYKKVVELLLAKGADVNAQGGYHGNALQAASSEGHEKVVELLLAKGADVNAQGGHFNNALEVASYAGHEKVVELLLATGADVNVQGGDVGSALQAASNKGHEKVVELLLAKGADVNVQGGDFPTALQAASYKGYEKVVKLLLDKGANVNAQGGHFNNALEAASYAGHEKVVELLLAKGAVS
jgi:ankyrin repeat protein